jgi:hypothetical protein
MAQKAAGLLPIIAPYTGKRPTVLSHMGQPWSRRHRAERIHTTRLSRSPSVMGSAECTCWPRCSTPLPT